MSIKYYGFGITFLVFNYCLKQKTRFIHGRHFRLELIGVPYVDDYMLVTAQLSLLSSSSNGSSSQQRLGEAQTLRVRLREFVKPCRSIRKT
jgi:hypothetical protein